MEGEEPGRVSLSVRDSSSVSEDCSVSIRPPDNISCAEKTLGSVKDRFRVAISSFSYGVRGSLFETLGFFFFFPDTGGV